MGSKSSCYHCGETCPNESINIEQKIFCCEGCKTVYEILDANGLETYYQIENKPGIPQNTRNSKNDYQFLDEAEAFEKLIRFREGNLVHIDLRIPQIHCASCVWLLENLNKLEPGILSSEVRFLERKLLLRFDLSRIKLSQIARLIANLGYVPDISLQDLEGLKIPKKDHSFYYKLGVAGFCAGNIMLMSFPEYLGLEHLEFKAFFSWINLVLALPVLLYSANIFFKSAWNGLVQGNLNIDVPVSIGILALFFQSLYEILSQQGPGYLDSLAGLVFFLLIGKWFQQKSYEQLSFNRDFRSYFPIAATVIDQGKESSVLLSELKKGDTIFVRNEEVIPADATLLEEAVYIDYSFVSGESDPVSKLHKDKLFAGGKVVGKGVRVKLLKTVSESYLTQLWQNHGPSQKKQKGIQYLADRLSKNFTLGILSIAILAGIYWFFRTDIQYALQISIAVLIVACPCGLALSSPIVLGNAMRILGRNGFFLKNSQVLEHLANIDELVFDKTGTLTHAQRDGSFDGLNTLPHEQKSLLAALAKESSHPMSKQIQQELIHITPSHLQNSEEVPGQGIRGQAGEHLVQIGNARMFDNIQNKQLAEGSTGIAIDGQLLLSVSRNEKPRTELHEVLQQLQKKYKLGLLTGDAQIRAESLREYFPENSSFLWEQLPEDKLQHIKNLQQQGRKVIMVGDGLNDAGALMQADIGIVMAEKLESFSPACEVILDAKSFPMLPGLLSYAKRSTGLLKSALFISLLYNLLGLGFAVQGLLSPLVAAILMPLSSISIILWGLGSTSLLAKIMKLSLVEK